MSADSACKPAADLALDDLIEAATRCIAPSWPLDQSIAVNPYWGWVEQSIDQADADLLRLSGKGLWVTREQTLAAWRAGEFRREHLRQALAEAGSSATPEQLIEALTTADQPPTMLPLLVDLLDSRLDLHHRPSWQETLTQQISQFCASYFDADQAEWRPPSSAGLYAEWRLAIQADRGVDLIMNEAAITPRAAALPTSAREMIARALTQLAVPSTGALDWLQAALMRINGWSAWAAYLRWQARLRADDDEHLLELLAIRLAWECLLDDGDRGPASVWAAWQQAWRHARGEAAAERQAQAALWQRAQEIAYQTPLAQALAREPQPPSAAPAAVQAVFCIDVRSEIFRRALERVAPTTRTHGFAGFFGLPIEFTPLATAAARPQLPGLLAPVMRAGQSTGCTREDAVLRRARHARLDAERAGLAFRSLPGSAFTLVETLGLGCLGKLIGRNLVPRTPLPAIQDHGLHPLQARRLRPVLELADADADAADQGADLAQRVLTAMSLGADLARLVLLVGHGAQTSNNPQAAGLDCGACCGQTGEVNARALAALLNAPAVREQLRDRGVAISARTHFIAALHNTTTDEVTLFDTDLLPSAHAGDLVNLRTALAAAGALARRERAARLGLQDLCERPEALLREVQARANDWAQTRPEWGLANNAALIVAPRGRTRAVDLGGRAFLHDYHWQRDADGSVLESIMTAPMVVAHWINMQYNASTVDNERYGSGNKLLHNVVGGRIGVFEGNGGDLRIGLAMQSLHDGARWMHTPLRLSVFVEAPQATIEAVIGKHALVRQLVEHGWLHLFRIDPLRHCVEVRRQGQWRPCASPEQVGDHVATTTA